MRKFHRPFTIEAPIEKEDQEFFTKKDKDISYSDGIDDLWTVEDADGVVISTHKTKEGAVEGLLAAERTL